MSEDKKIRISADASDYMRQMNQVSSDSKKLFESLKSDSENQFKDQKRINDELKTRIELLKEQNRLQREQNQEINRQQYSQGTINREEYNASSNRIRYEGKFDTQQERELNRQYQQYVSSSRGGDSEGGTNMLASVGKGGLKALGWLGVAVSVMKAADEFKDGLIAMEYSLKDYSILSGQGIGSESIMNEVKGLDSQNIYNIGAKPSDYFQSLYKQRTSRGGISKDSGVNLMALDRATTLDEGNIGSLLETQRYSPNMSVSGTVASLRDVLKDNSRSVEEMNVRLKETTESITSVSDDIIRTSGGMSAAQMSGLLSTTMGVQRMTGLQGKPLETVQNALSSGLKMSSNPVMQSIQMDAMRRAMPNANMWEIEKGLETPMDNPEYVWNMLQSLNSLGGEGQSDKERMIYNAFKDSGMTKSLAGSLTKGTTKEQFMKNYNTTMGRDFVADAASKTGGVEKLTAAYGGGFESQGFETGEGISQTLSGKTIVLEDVLDKTGKALGDFIGQVKQVTKGLAGSSSNIISINNHLRRSFGIANPLNLLKIDPTLRGILELGEQSDDILGTNGQ